MKKIKLFSLLLALATLTFTFSSCSDDEPTIPVEEGLAIADGFYMTISDTDPVSTGQLKSEVVEDVSFGTQEREGYLAGYVFLAAGDYQLVEVASKKIVSTLGGVASTRNTDTDDVAGTNDGLSGCGYNDYTLVAATVDGDAFNVASAGIYKVTYDKTLSEIVLFKIEKAQLIGAATPIGWDTKSDMATLAIDGTATADSVSFKISGVVLRPGEFKIRFGCRWKIDRRVDKTLPTDTHAASNGYVIQTNFGGELSGGKIIKLAPGGENVVIPAGGDGEYEVVAKWTPADGFSISVTKTGDVDPTYPDVMYLVGAGTAYGWDEPGTVSDAGAEMHKIAGDVAGIYWKILHLEAGPGFKISNANWTAPDLGFSDVSEYDGDGVTVSDNGGNMDIAASGMYMVVLDLRDDMRKVSIIEPKVYGIGTGAFTNWDEENANNLFTVDNNAKTIVSPAIAGTGGIRTYVDHAWIAAWWNAEFIPKDGKIVYRNNGGDPEEVTATVSQVITYTFDNNTATIE